MIADTADIAKPLNGLPLETIKEKIANIVPQLKDFLNWQVLFNNMKSRTGVRHQSAAYLNKDPAPVIALKNEDNKDVIEKIKKETLTHKDKNQFEKFMNDIIANFGEKNNFDLFYMGCPRELQHILFNHLI
ncbi:MAG: hypothetical protein LBF44_01135 [Holosporaceae bacterium]|jgi:hypothetical protein|nr:hypothetical protein [Holosporaceae bacterium]